MVLIQTFRCQHHQIEAIVHQVDERLSEQGLVEAEADIRGLIRGLLTRMKIHHLLEEDILHPKMLQHHDRRVAAIAQRRAIDAERLLDVIHRHRERWAPVESVGCLAPSYVVETRRLLHELIRLLHQENDEFDLIERGQVN